MRYAKGTLAVFIWLVLILPYLLTVGRFWHPKETGVWGWILQFVSDNLPKP